MFAPKRMFAPWWYAVVAGLLLSAAPGVANAQGWRDAGQSDLLTPFGEYLLLGGGVTDFTQSATKDRFDVGGAWDVRLGLGSRYYVGGELAYVGSMRSGVGSVPDLYANGAEGVVRIQYPYASGKWLVEPFAFGGLGWSHLSLRNAAPGLEEGDDIGVVPFGAGVTLGYGRALLDARFTYRSTFSEDLRLAPGDVTPSFEQWAVGASLGYEF